MKESLRPEEACSAPVSHLVTASRPEERHLLLVAVPESLVPSVLRRKHGGLVERA